MVSERVQNLKERCRSWAGPVFVLVMLVAALYLLHIELKKHTLQDFLDELRKIPVVYLLGAILLTVLNYAILVCYDWLGIWYIRHPMKFGRVALASFLGYAVGNNFGLLFGGSTIRYRLYSSWGLSTSDIVRLLFILAITFWIGLFALAGLVFLIYPLPVPENWHLPFRDTQPIGIVLTLAASIYLAICALRRKPLKFKEVDCSPPPVGLAIMQYLVAGVDLLVQAGILYVLLITVTDVSFFHFVAIFLLAQVAIFITQVPGGIGVLELSIIALLREDEAAVFGALLAFRMIFYLTPMMIGLILLVAHELIANRDKLQPTFEMVSRWTPDIAPRLLAFTTFSAGVVAVFAAATPTTTARIARVNQFLPLGMIETGYVLSAVNGAALMVVARGLMHQVTSSFWWTVALCGMGVIFSFVGDFGIEIGVFLLVITAVIAPCRHYFFRDNLTNPDRISIRWLTAISVVLGVSFWLMWFAYKGGESIELNWLWTSGHDSHAQRSLRALTAAVLFVAICTVIRVLRITLTGPRKVSRRELEAARKIVAAAPQAMAQIALFGDKRLLMNIEQTALVAYAVSGNSWVACGDPVGPRDDALQVAWDFYELCKTGDNWPVFYNVDASWLDVYREMGLEVRKIAQEAVVDLPGFDLAASQRREFQEIIDKLEPRGVTFEVIQPPETRDVLPIIGRISELWLLDGHKREHGFSIPRYDAERIAHLPVGIARQQGNAIGFATIWPGAGYQELAIGLLRHLPDAPLGITEYLITQTMNWGKTRGYRSLNLGLAPILEEQQEQESPLRSQLTKLIFPHAEHVYSRHGLRNFKERFDPVWKPKYLASPGSYTTKRVLEHVAKLIDRP